ncbi:MAG: DUF2726 domain-containing protein [Maricaulaceae bacterium]
MDDILTPLIALLIITVFIVLWLKRPASEFQVPQTKSFNPKIFKYFTARESLFVNKSEAVLFDILYKTLSPKYRVFTKVRLEDIIGVRTGNMDAKVRWSLRGRVKSRHVDFVISTPKGQVLMMIELDGTSHLSSAAQHADAFKDALANAVNIPLYRINTDDNFHKKIAVIQRQLSGH